MLQVITKTETANFKEWLDNVPKCVFNDFKELIAKRCKVSMEGVNNWYFRGTQIKPVYKDIINDLAQKNNVNKKLKLI